MTIQHEITTMCQEAYALKPRLTGAVSQCMTHCSLDSPLCCGVVDRPVEWLVSYPAKMIVVDATMAVELISLQTRVNTCSQWMRQRHTWRVRQPAVLHCFGNEINPCMLFFQGRRGGLVPTGSLWGS